MDGDGRHLVEFFCFGRRVFMNWRIWRGMYFVPNFVELSTILKEVGVCFWRLRDAGTLLLDVYVWNVWRVRYIVTSVFLKSGGFILMSRLFLGRDGPMGLKL